MRDFDHYSAARNLISRLEADGYGSDATKLQSAMDDGATGTEIFMALRFHLSDIIQRVQLRGGAQILASQLLDELNRALE